MGRWNLMKICYSQGHSPVVQLRYSFLGNSGELESLANFGCQVSRTQITQTSIRKACVMFWGWNGGISRVCNAFLLLWSILILGWWEGKCLGDFIPVSLIWMDSDFNQWASSVAMDDALICPNLSQWFITSWNNQKTCPCLLPDSLDTRVWIRFRTRYSFFLEVF